jgi:hypothetical protein
MRLRPLFVAEFESGRVLIYLKTMNRSEIAKQLAQAEREVAADAANVERQRTLVAELSQQGRDIEEAFGRMIFLEERLALHTQDRDWFFRALESGAE